MIMANQTNLATVEVPTDLFVLPNADLSVPGDFSREDLAEDMEGMRLSFPRVKIPAGGVLQFEMPGDDPEPPQYVDKLTGVLLFHHATNGYWPHPMDDEDKNPICSSVDGKMGIGEPGGVCAACELNAFGTAEDGKGKACKNMRSLYLLQSGDLMPIVLNLPPTSLKGFNDFMNVAFLTRGRASYGSVIEISLKRMNNGNPYSVATFSKLYDFTGEELAQIKAFAANFRQQARAMLEERAKALQSQQDDGCDYDYDPADGGVKVGAAQREELPL